MNASLVVLRVSVIVVGSLSTFCKALIRPSSHTKPMIITMWEGAFLPNQTLSLKLSMLAVSR